MSQVSKGIVYAVAIVAGVSMGYILSPPRAEMSGPVFHATLDGKLAFCVNITTGSGPGYLCVAPSKDH